jgi:hypothetical protein
LRHHEDNGVSWFNAVSYEIRCLEDSCSPEFAECDGFDVIFIVPHGDKTPIWRRGQQGFG